MDTIAALFISAAIKILMMSFGIQGWQFFKSREQQRIEKVRFAVRNVLKLKEILKR